MGFCRLALDGIQRFQALLARLATTGLVSSRATVYVFLMLPVVLAQSQDFEVAAIKPHASSNPCGSSDAYPGGRLVLDCFTLSDLIREALDLQPDELTGGPDWIRTDRWDILAKAEGRASALTPAEYRPMLWKLVEQNFHLELRAEKRSVKGFELLVETKVKARPGLVQNAGEPYRFDLKPGLSLAVQGVTMKEFAAWLKMPMGVGRRVEDHTGLVGRYNFHLHWSPAILQVATQLPEGDGPSIFTALKEQLGLKLRPARVAGDVLVIQAVQRPGE